MDIERLKVVQLRKELRKRHLDTKGRKTVLVARLKTFIDNKASNTKTRAPKSKKTKKDNRFKEKTEFSQSEIAPSLNPDVLLRIFSHLNSSEIITVSSVSNSWSMVAKSDYVWKALYTADFKLPFVPLNKNDRCVGKNPDAWVEQYKMAYRRIPKLMDASQINKEIADHFDFKPETRRKSYTKAKEERKDWHTDSHTDESIEEDLFDDKYIFFRHGTVSKMFIDVPKRVVNDKVHDLALVLSILNEKNLLIRLDDTVQIGSVSVGSIPVKLSVFCHAFLQGETSKLYPEVVFPRGEITMKTDETAPWELDDRDKLMGISPNIKGEFKPFVLYNEIHLYSGKALGTNMGNDNKNDGNHVPDFSRLDSFISRWVLDTKNTEKTWVTDFKMWAPGFFMNANFYWYHYGDFKSVYSPKHKEIIVAKMDVKQFSSFC